MSKLPQYTLSNTARPIGELVHLVEQGEIDTDTPYQRGLVWGTHRQVMLVRSILMRVPVSSLVINRRLGSNFHAPGYEEATSAAYAVVDGKQRLTTFVAFLGSELAVPANWFDRDDIADTDAGDHVVYRQLTQRTQRSIERLPVAVEEAQVSTLAAERELFDLINFAGVPQGPIRMSLDVRPALKDRDSYCALFGRFGGFLFHRGSLLARREG